LQYQGRFGAIRFLAPIGWLCLIWASLPVTAHASDSTHVTLADRTDALISKLDIGAMVDRATSSTLPAIQLTIEQCGGYPYEEPRETAMAHADLLGDLRQGLATGLSCLAGSGPAGKLHPHHEHQARRLLGLLESQQPKTIRCVADQMFATAVATAPIPLEPGYPLADQLKLVSYPGIVLDTYRLGGLLSRAYDDDTFRSFFHLNDEQIFEHRNGQPIRPPSLHRFKDRPALLFHEMVHWLGHEHSAIHPDLAHLYETCCFGGSDYIDSDALNRGHQQTACNILRDEQLWADGTSIYKQMRIWHHKGYGKLKKAMRNDYAR
jgi:hypothetical protein